jgi:BNR repeat-like domain
MDSKSKLSRSLTLLPVMAMLLALLRSLPVYAQTSNDPWTPPVNLSHSGSTTNPVTAQDSKGTIHVIWQDKYADYVYTRLQGDSWSQPVSVPVPFGDTPPKLLADSKGFLHAFWIDNDGSLAYVHMTPRPTGLTFDKSQFIAEAALSFDATIDAKDNIHVVYVRPKDVPGVPSGVYYRQSSDGGISWASGDLIYPSPYFRGLEKKDANVSIATVQDGDQSRIYVAWDNKPRKQVFFSMSSNEGRSWSDPKEVQGADTSSGSASPYGIQVGAFDKNVILVWQNGDPTGGCVQWYQSSSNEGESWNPSKTMLTELVGCPGNNHLVTSTTGLIFLMTAIQDQIYLLAWDGKQWSDPQYQRTLTGFLDPETQDMVQYACQNPVLLADGRMFVVGCDDGSGGDIWATSAPVSDVNSWFPPPPVWSEAQIIQEVNSEISSPSIIADLQGRFHAFWIQSETLLDTTGNTTTQTVIYHSEYDGSKWSTPVIVITSPAGDADQPMPAVDDKDRLMVVWRGMQTGNLYFSWANADNANSPAEWSAPSALPAVQPLVSAPYITVDQAGKIYVVYAIPINEDRGIFLTTSTDVGQTWSKPIKVVDAVDANLEMVDQPQILITSDEHIHVTWKAYKLIGDNSPIGVYYVRSEDNGKSWTDPETLVEGEVYWSNFASTEGSIIHLIWQDKTFRGFGLRQQVSLDGGQTWSRPTTIIDVGISLVPASLATGSGSQATLLAMDVDQNTQVLKQWVWKGDKWIEDATLDLSSDASIQTQALSSAIFPLGKLGAVYSQVEPGKVEGENDFKLFFVERKIQSASGSPVSTPVQTQQPSLTITPRAETSITPTPTSTQIVTPTQATATVADATAQPISSGRTRTETIIGLALIFVVVGVAIGLVVRVVLNRGE